MSIHRDGGWRRRNPGAQQADLVKIRYVWSTLQLVDIFLVEVQLPVRTANLGQESPKMPQPYPPVSAKLTLQDGTLSELDSRNTSYPTVERRKQTLPVQVMII